jgi:hypothetical protein
MTETDQTPEPQKKTGMPKPLGFAAGAGIGLFLWLVISLTTQNMLLGLLFGILPGMAIGAGLQLTAKR